MQKTQLGQLIEYSCHIGHRYGWKTMVVGKSDLIERAITQALSQTEEIVKLLDANPEQLDVAEQEDLQQEIQNRNEQARHLRELLESKMAFRSQT